MNHNGRTVLVVGGAGYVGAVVVDHLLARGYRVRCLDLLLFDNANVVLSAMLHDHYEFIHGDFADTETARRALTGVTDVVMLAGLVGDPITRKYPAESEAINERGMSSFFSQLADRGLDRVIFVSTCSNYGIIAEDELADEDTVLTPLSPYAKAKVDRELELLALRGLVDYTPTILRFSTAFGVAPRMRFDLTVNHFTHALHTGEDLEVYDAFTWRPYCHVKDFARAIRTVLEVPKDAVDFAVFNVGSDDNNYTKKMIVEAVQKYVATGDVVYKEHGVDARNYRVDFGRIRTQLDFTPRYSVEAGVEEILGCLKSHLFDDIEERRNFYGNYEIAYTPIG